MDKNGQTSLFSSAELPNLTLPNRIVMSPMTRARASGPDAVPTTIMETYYEQRASAGLIISEGIIISPLASGYIKVPGIYTDEQIAAWSRVTDKVHKAGGRIFAQLWHVGRISHPNVIGGQTPLAPSAINANFFAFAPSGRVDTVTPRAMTLQDIKNTVADFRKAAENAIAAGFDGVEIHAANGYLINQFLAASANHRDDEYGGSLENRSRFLFEVVSAIINGIGNHRVGIRLNPIVNAAGIEDCEEMKKTYEAVIARLSTMDLSYLHIAAMTMRGDDTAEATLAVGRHYRALYSGRIILNAGLDKASASLALADGTADLVAFGKAFVSNPDLVRRLRDGVELAPVKMESLYFGGEEGYIDYPAAD